MIPILYESTETEFNSNGLGRLRDCISCVVTEARNSVYECDFEFPVNGSGYEKIKLGRIIAVEHDDSDDVQPFDIVSCSRPINGIVKFHAQHISYRQSGLTTYGENVNSLADAFTALASSTPDNPFSYYTDKTDSGFIAVFDGVPRSVRSILGGTEGSILEVYGGEYEWDKWTVKLWAARGQTRNFTIRYGVNMIDYTEELDYTGAYTSVLPYWKGGSDNVIVIGDAVSSGVYLYGSRNVCIPLDLTERFESKPTAAQLEALAAEILESNEPYFPTQNITVDFVRLQDADEYSQFEDLLECKLCDTVRVVFPMYSMSGNFKIVKTEYDVLLEKYNLMELGALSTSLAEALGISDMATSVTDSAPTTTALSASDFTVTTGAFVSGTLTKWGKVAQLTLSIRNTSSVAAGSNLFQATLTDDSLRPLQSTTAGAYYGAHAANGFLNASGNITIRNSSSSAFAVGSNSSITISFTYIV